MGAVNRRLRLGLIRLLRYLYLLYCTVQYTIYIIQYTVEYSIQYTVQYSTLYHNTVLFCAVLYCTVLYCTVLYCTVLYSVLYVVTKVKTGLHAFPDYHLRVYIGLLSPTKVRFLLGLRRLSLQVKICVSLPLCLSLSVHPIFQFQLEIGADI